MEHFFKKLLWMLILKCEKCASLVAESCLTSHIDPLFLYIKPLHNVFVRWFDSVWKNGRLYKLFFIYFAHLVPKARYSPRAQLSDVLATGVLAWKAIVLKRKLSAIEFRAGSLHRQAGSYNELFKIRISTFSPQPDIFYTSNMYFLRPTIVEQAPASHQGIRQCWSIQKAAENTLVYRGVWLILYVILWSALSDYSNWI